MKKKYILWSALGAMLSLASCESVLDKTDLNAASPELIAGDSVLANIALNYIYNQNLPDWGGPTAVSGIGGSVYTEESYNQGSGQNKYLEGAIAENDVTDFGTALNATNNYGKIRTINTFIADLEKDNLMDKGAKVALLLKLYSLERGDTLNL
jgi:hypothetical protein